jgi:nucleoside-diphosphate-sugar epimerase
MLGRFLCNEYNDCRVTSLGLDSANDIICDIANNKPALSVRFDTVIHAAGSTYHENAMEVNLNGTINLCEALSNNPPQQFVFISSVQVYGIDSREDIDESTPANPTTPYGKSKLQAEQYLAQWCNSHNVTLSILRPALIMGTGMKGTLLSMVKGISDGYYFHIKGNDARRSIVHALDVAKAARLIAPIGGTFNLTDNTHPTVHDLAESIALRIGGKRIYTLPRWCVNIAAKIGDIMGDKAPLSSKKLQQITNTLTFNSDAISKVIDWTPVNVSEYLRNHQYTDNDI